MRATARPADEDAFSVPESWLRFLHPRRGGASVPLADLAPGAPAAVRSRVEEIRGELDHLLDAGSSRADLVEPARAWLDGEANARGAAVVAAVIAAETVSGAEPGLMRYDGLAVIADAWVVEHGLTFAAAATAELARVHVDGYDYNGRRTGRHLRVRSPNKNERSWNHAQTCVDQVAARVRALLSAAGDRSYQDAVDALALRRRDDAQRITVSYLVPDQREWVTEVCAKLNPQAAREDLFRLLRAVGSTEHLDLLGDRSRDMLGWADPLFTVAEGIGPAVAPVVARIVDEDRYWGDSPLRVLAALPTDEAFNALVERLDMPLVHAAAVEAAGRFPRRAVRLLAAAAAAGTSADTSAVQRYAARMLRDVVAAEPDAVAAVVPGLPAPVREVVETIDARAGEWPPYARPEELAPLLTAPPWIGERAPVKRPSVRGLTPPAGRTERWEPGEREKWTARFGTDTLPAAFDLAAGSPADAPDVLLPFCDADTAALMADRLARRRPGLAGPHPVVHRWFHRHARDAAAALVPAALGKAGDGRRQAETALRFLAVHGHTAAITDAARDHGTKAAKAIDVLLATDPLVQALPAELPEIPRWADPYLLPQLLLRDTERALPAAAVRHVITMLAMSKPDRPYPGVDAVREICTPESLAAFAWGLFERSGLRGREGGTGDEAWVMTALGLLGDDTTVRGLTPVIRKWPGIGGHHCAVAGLDALVAIGTDVALMHLNGIAQRIRYKGLRAKAQDRIAALAAGLGLSPERLADRLVPDLGLDAGGGLTLDYGPRRFTVGFDEQLKPYVLDEDGRRRASLPKPGARDDQALAPAAHQRFAALRKDVRTVASDQVVRLERAMVAGRRWPAAEFRELIAGHPLLWHIARRLVWATADGATFRIAEDRTFAGVDDTGVHLADTARVGVPHPLNLAGDTIAAWSEIFADYELLQPFPQLGRPVHALTDDERAGTELKRFHGATAPTRQVLGMERRGWQRGSAEDNGIQCWITRPIGGGTVVVATLDPGIPVNSPDYWPEQRIEQVWLNAGTELGWRVDAVPLPFSGLDAVTASEILTDLTALTAATG